MIKALLFALLFAVIGLVAFGLLAPLLFYGADFRELGAKAFSVVVFVCGGVGFVIGWRRKKN